MKGVSRKHQRVCRRFFFTYTAKHFGRSSFPESAFYRYLDCHSEATMGFILWATWGSKTSDKAARAPNCPTISTARGPSAIRYVSGAPLLIRGRRSVCSEASGIEVRAITVIKCLRAVELVRCAIF